MKIQKERRFSAPLFFVFEVLSMPIMNKESILIFALFFT